MDSRKPVQPYYPSKNSLPPQETTPVAGINPKSTAKRRFRHQDYTVAWICALPLEMAAAAAMLDERHADLPARPNDHNTYILGQIYGHNVAIACLPVGVYGTTSAAIVATQMQSTFESIRFGLMIGIGGGVPSRNVDIRLGDVVVSKPTRDSGGVIQYDYGKTVAGGRFERTGVLNKPPSVLLTAVSRLQAEHELEPSRIPALLAEAVTKNPGVRGKFAYRGEDQDLLFDSEYDHPDPGKACDSCDTKRLVARSARSSHYPVIHYGLIASANQVMKHGRSRDNLARQLDILCFEMEAAGLMDNFPCLVVRGICDYSDSHKNKQWQEYAAATAAVYGKDLLSVVHVSHVVNTLPVASISDVSYCRDKPPFEVKLPRREIVRSSNGQEVEELFERISSYDHERIHRRLTRKRLIGTTSWFIDHPDFKSWFVEKRNSSLWCSGKIGSGKTMIATAVIDAAKYELESPTVFFYCEAEHHATLEVSSILSSFIKQLCECLRRMARPYPEDMTREIKRFFGHKRVQPDLEDLKDIFTLCFHHVPETVYVIDGVDSLDREHARFILELFRSLLNNSRPQQAARVFLLSRDQVQGYINITTLIPGIRQISTSNNVMQDIETYVRTSITDKTMYRKITEDPLLIEEIERRLLKESSGMFLWAYLQLEILWDTCHTDAEIRAALSALPKGLEETYGRCIERIDPKDSRALKVLKWVSFARRPLHIDELREAIAFDTEDTEWNAEKIPRKEFVIGCCANLVVVDSTDGCVRLAHSSVKQYLEKGRERETIRWYPTTAQGVLECGELCIAYLSFSDFSIQLTTRGTRKAEVAVPSPILLAQRALPGLFTRRFSQEPRNQKRFVSVPFREIRTSSRPDQTQYRFLAYAITNWAMQTKEIPRTSVVWEKFERLAMCFNETWNFHPWAPGGRSASSHLHGLFGWAVKEQHEPLLLIAKNAKPDLKTICNLPLIAESLPALHVAAKFGYTAIIKILLGFCKVNLTDLDGYTAFHHAASRGHIEICQLVLDTKQINLNAPTKSQCTPLWLAASNGHDEVVSLLIENQSNIEAKGASFRQTPLSQAARNGHGMVVALLLEKGANLESEDAEGQTPLLQAARNGHNVVIELLLKRGANLESEDAEGQTPLLQAARNGHGMVVALLLEKGANIESEDIYGQTPLLQAARNGHNVVIELLLERGANLESEDAEGQTALSQAIQNGHDTAVESLLATGTDRSKYADNINPTPNLLLQAARNGHDVVVELLLERGANLESRDIYGQTPLLLAAKNEHWSVMKLLVDMGANLEARSAENGHTPLLWATENGNEALVTLLVDKGANLEVRAIYNLRTPLFLALEIGHKAVVRLLIDRGADLEASTMDGQTPLSWAAENGLEAMAKLLIDKGADLEARTSEIRTPLSSAAMHGHRAMVKLLVDRGADMEAINSVDGNTPLEWAVQNGHDAVAKLLVEMRAKDGI